MADEQDRIVYESVVPHDPTRIGAAALYCSDGRFCEQCDDFLHNALELPRYDRLAVPGGAACLAGHFDTFREEEAVIAQLEFLVTVHDLQRVVVIAHQDCAFYTQRLRISPLGLADQQREDLAKAVDRVRGFGRNLAVDAYFAHTRGDHVAFEWLEV